MSICSDSGFVLASLVNIIFALDLSLYVIKNYMFSALSKKQHALVTSWCIRTENKLHGVLSPAAFLVEIGKVLVAQQIIADGKQEEFTKALADLGDVEAAERQVVGTDTPEVSATIFKQWKFEDGLVNVIGNCLNPDNAEEDDKRTATILMAVRAAVPINGVVTEDRIMAAKEIIAKYTLNLESIETAIDTVK